MIKVFNGEEFVINVDSVPTSPIEVTAQIEERVAGKAGQEIHNTSLNISASGDTTLFSGTLGASGDIKKLTVFNPSGNGAEKIRVLFDDGTNQFTLAEKTLQATDFLRYDQINGWV